METQKYAVTASYGTADNATKWTVNDFGHFVDRMTDEYQLTQAGKSLAKGCQWSFNGDEYRQAWGYLFKKSRQLGLTYCKHFKRFYRPLPPKPAIGARVRLTSVDTVGTVTGYDRFDVLVRIDGRDDSVPVGIEYLVVL